MKVWYVQLTADAVHNDAECKHVLVVGKFELSNSENGTKKSGSFYKVLTDEDGVLLSNLQKVKFD